MAFAEVSDVEARWRTLSATEEIQAGILLEDASAMLSRLVQVDESDAEQAGLLKVVCANMVVRRMASSAAPIGTDQSSITAGPYSQTYRFAAPSGDMYITKAERRLLGIASGYIGSIRPMIGADHDCGC